ncbi:hypothetical protein AB0J20_13110 [Micromonospora costi]|uniref:hypothetical protein n=1 Tax=Micromonospora costi TaxID=1530042 RepID=UPI0033EA9285
MRRAVSSVTVALGLVGATVALTGVALAAPVPAAPASAEPTPGKKRCAITDDKLRELSGLVATKSGYVVVNDGTEIEARKRVFFLDSKCEVSKNVRYSGGGPLDTEDLALSPDGKTLWIADTGDNVTSKTRRERVAVWTMPLTGAKQPVLHRLSYPEKKPHDAEALLVGDDNVPLIITKVTSGKAEIYRPSGALKNGDTDPVPMEKVGEISLPKTETENPLNTFGRVAITGAARSPDGNRVVLRTYADAFEFDVTGGDIVAALTTGKPRVTPLTDPFGEAIAYTPDGKTFLTVSDAGQLGEDEPVEILSYTPSTTGAAPLAEDAAAKPAADRSWFDTLSLQDITYLIGAVGVVGALLVGAGIVGIIRARRRPASDGSDGPDRDDDLAGGRTDEDFPGADRPRGGVYGGAPAGGGVYGGAPAGGGVYGGGPGRGAAAPAGGGVYGGGRPAAGSGGVYGGGRPAAGGSGGRPAGSGSGGRPAAGGGGGRPGGGGGGVYGGGGRPPGGGRPGDGGYGGGQPGGGGVYGGGRAEPPRRGGPEPDYRGQRGRRREEDVDPYGQYPGGGRSYRGDRY